MASISANDLIASALRLAGAIAGGETPSATEIRDGLATLNDMLETWSTESLTVFSARELAGTLSAGVAGITVGPSGGIVDVRPIDVEAVTVRIGDHDYPVEVTRDAARYAAIGDKAMQDAVPLLAYFNPTHPNATLTFWPVPSSALPVRIVASVQFAALTDASQLLTYPPGYSRALRYSLALELAPEYGLAVRPDVLETAREAKAAIKRANIAPLMAEIDPAFLRQRGGYTGFLAGE